MTQVYELDFVFVGSWALPQQNALSPPPKDCVISGCVVCLRHAVGLGYGLWRDRMISGPWSTKLPELVAILASPSSSCQVAPREVRKRRGHVYSACPWYSELFRVGC